MLKRTLSLAPLAFLLACSAPAYCGVLYTDGGILGTQNGFFVDGPGSGPFAQTISDGFVDTTTGVAGSLDLGLWVTAGTTPTTLSWSLGTSVFGSDISSGTVAQVGYSFFGGTTFGYDVYSVHIDGLSGLLTAGNTYYLTLGGANNSTGNQLVGWDVNNGAATCNFAHNGNDLGGCGLGGEAFTISTASAPTPEPGSLLLLGSGMLALAGVLRRKVRA